MSNSTEVSSAMSGWQRIGVVLSVLWLVGLPVYLMNDTNMRAQDQFIDCKMAQERGLRWGTEADCKRAAGFMEWADLAQMFRGDPQDIYTTYRARGMWVFLLGPVVLLWLVGWIVFGTVRWVRRGFTGPGR
jgi:hypothetical protein